MGAVDLKADEQVMFPAPYAEDEVYSTVITTQRIVAMPAKGNRQEIPVDKVTFVGRLTKRPWLFPGLMLIVLALPAVVYAAYLFVKVMDLQPLDEDSTIPEDADDVVDPGKERIKAIVIGVLGLAVGAGGVLLLRKQKYMVQVRHGKKQTKLEVDDKMEQQQVLMTLQSAMNTAKQAEKTKAAQAAAAAQVAAATAAAQAAVAAATKVPGKK